MKIRTIVFGLVLAGGAATSGEAVVEKITTRVPEAHVKAYLASCSKEAPYASCWCAVEKMNASVEGQFVLDLVGLNLVGEPTKASVLAAVNRHGLRASEAEAIFHRYEAVMKGAVTACV